MTEAEWLDSTDPQAMLAHLDPAGPHPDPAQQQPRPQQISDRKLRLFACACCRQVCEQLTDERSRLAVEVSERFADGEATVNEMDRAWRESVAVLPRNAAVLASFVSIAGDASIAVNAPELSQFVSSVIQTALLRDIFGNPWRPIWFAKSGVRLVQTPTGLLRVNPSIKGPVQLPTSDGSFLIATDVMTLDPSILAWNDGTVPKIAQAIYQDRNFADLPILADALEEAGCDSSEILDHCRGPGPHVRGCWVLDLLLGKN